MRGMPSPSPTPKLSLSLAERPPEFGGGVMVVTEDAVVAAEDRAVVGLKLR